MSAPSLTASWTHLVALIVRRDRWSLPVWIVAALAFSVGMVPMLPSIAGTPEALAASGLMMQNPALIAMCGIVYQTPPTMGSMYAQMMLVWSAMLVAIMNILIVVRHTRTDEDEGRLEVIRSLPAGRVSSLAAITVVIFGVDVALALLTGLSMTAFSVDSIDLTGSMVYGAALGACGFLFAMIALVAIQLTESARTATAGALTLVGALYVMRAYGDMSSETIAKLSPFGLIQRIYAFDTNRWWPVVVLVGAAVVALILAISGNAHREPGQSLLPPLRQGRAHASRWLANEWGLAWRLSRPTMLAWGLTAFVVAAAYGTVMNNMESYVLSNSVYQQMTGVDPSSGDDVTGAVVGMLMIIMASLGVIPVLSTTNRLVGEEREGRMDYVLGRTVSRTSQYVAYGTLAVAAAAGMQLLTATGFWMVASAVMTHPVKASLVFGIAGNYLAGMLGFAGLGLCLAGAAKRFSWIGWGYLAVTFVVVYLGGVMNVPRWAQRLTPLGLLQRYPTEEFSWWPWIALVIAAWVLALLGLTSYHSRDVTS